MKPLQHTTAPPTEIECIPCVKLIYKHLQNTKQETRYDLLRFDWKYKDTRSIDL